MGRRGIDFTSEDQARFLSNFDQFLKRIEIWGEIHLNFKTMQFRSYSIVLSCYIYL